MFNRGAMKAWGYLLVVAGMIAFWAGVCQMVTPIRVSIQRDNAVQTPSNTDSGGIIILPLPVTVPDSGYSAPDYDPGAGWDSGTDSGSWDLGGTDSGSWDTGGWDSGGSDSGSWDSGGWDSGGFDSGGSDSGSW